MLDAIEAGESVEYESDDPKDRTGKRLSLARRARRRGFTLEIRYNGQQMAVRKGGEVAPEEPQQRAPRRRKGSEESA